MQVIAYENFFNMVLFDAEVTMIPQNYVSLAQESDINSLNKILDLLDDSDDVQAVYTNYEEQ